jgi:hypothetical protein
VTATRGDGLWDIGSRWFSTVRLPTSKFTLLQEAGCASAVFTTDSLPTNADIIVTRLDFDDTDSLSLAEAIEAALATVKGVPDLSVPGLTVPAQPAHITAEKPEEDTSATAESETKPAAQKATVGKSGGKRASSKKSAAAPDDESAATAANGHSSADLVDAPAESD